MDKARVETLIERSKDDNLSKMIVGSEVREVCSALLAAAREGEHESVVGEVAAERVRQHAKWGEQNHISGQDETLDLIRRIADAATRPGFNETLPEREAMSREAKRLCKSAKPDTYTRIFLEEVFEALAEDDPAKLRAELVQVAAVAVQWIEAIDRAARAAMGEP